MKAWEALIGSGIVFGEDLCYEFHQLQQQVKAHPDVTDTWAWNGKIFAKSRDNPPRQILMTVGLSTSLTVIKAVMYDWPIEYQ